MPSQRRGGEWGETPVLLCGGEVVGCIVWWEGFDPISGDNYTVYCLP